MAEQKRRRGRFTQADLALALNFSKAAVSKYLSGAVRPSEKFVNTLLDLVYGDDEPAKEAKRNEILRPEPLVRKDRTTTFADFEAHAVAFDFVPFLDKKQQGFTRKICERLFDLAGIPFDIDFVGRFGDMFARVNDPKKPHTMILHISETIPRSKRFHTFHTPVSAPLNIIAPIRLLSPASRDGIADSFLDNRAVHPFFAVREEIGYSYLKDVLKLRPEELTAIEVFDPASIAREMREIGPTDGHNRPRLFIGDEFLCLQVAEALNVQNRTESRQNPYGFLFPLGTLAVARSTKFAKIPTYKYGLFSVPRQMENVVELLTNAFNTLLDNERHFVALAYADLGRDLTNLVERCVRALPDDARADLERLHRIAGERFQFLSTSEEFAEALAARISRQAMRLNTQLLETDDDLNLRWRPVLELVRRRILGPLRAEYRDLHFDQALVRCTVFPPFLSSSRESRRSDADDGRVFARIDDWGPFGPVMAQMSDLVNVEDHEAVLESQLEDQEIGSDSQRMTQLPDFTVGIFDIARRAQDAHLFRFPISLRLNALIPPSAADAAQWLRMLLSANAAFCWREALEELNRALAGRVLVPIVLQYTAAHYQCWQWRYPPEFVRFDPRVFDTQTENFTTAFRRALDAENAGSGRTAIIIADELTCFRVKRRIRNTNAALLFPPRDVGGRTRHFYSIAVRRSRHDEWWKIMREMLPASVAKSQQELVTALVTARLRIDSDALEGCDGDRRAANAWLDGLFCKDLAQPTVAWNEHLLSPAWQPVLSGLFREQHPKEKNHGR